MSEPNYITADTRLRSWLFTTDHKRVAILYFAGITMFFFVGGAAATLIRLELATPAGDFVSSDVYNRLFTMHGIVMVWLFLVRVRGGRAPHRHHDRHHQHGRAVDFELRRRMGGRRRPRGRRPVGGEPAQHYGAARTRLSWPEGG
jgi:hypothetical protein